MKIHLKPLLIIASLLLLNACGNSCYDDVTIGENGAYTQRTVDIQMQAYSANPDLAYTDTGVDVTDKSDQINLTITGDVWLCSNKNWIKGECPPKDQSDTDPNFDKDGNPCLKFKQYNISAKTSTQWVQIDQYIYKDDVLLLSVGQPSPFDGSRILRKDPPSPEDQQKLYGPQINAWTYNDKFIPPANCPSTLPLLGTPADQYKNCPVLYKDYPDEPNVPYYTCPQSPTGTSDETAFQTYLNKDGRRLPLNCWMVGGAGLRLGLSVAENCADAENNKKWFNELNPTIDPNTTPPTLDLGVVSISMNTPETRNTCAQNLECRDSMRCGEAKNQACCTTPIDPKACCKNGKGKWVVNNINNAVAACTNGTILRSISGVSRDYASLCVKLPDLDGTNNLGGYQLNILRMSCKATKGQLSEAAGKKYFNLDGAEDTLPNNLGTLEYVISANTPGTSGWTPVPIQDGQFIITPTGIPEKTKQRLYLRIADNDYRDNGGLYNVSISYKDYSSAVIVSATIEYIKNMITDLTVGRPKHPGSFVAYFKNMSKNADGRPTDYVQFIRVLLILYIVTYGIAFTMGSVQISQKDLLIRTIKIGLVLILITDQSWDFFNKNFFTLFTDGVNDLIKIATLQNFSKETTTFYFIDDFLALMFSKTTLLKIFAITIVSPLGVVLAIMFLISIILFLIGTFKVVVSYLESILVISLLIMLAPIFIPCILFGPTRSLFENWIKKLVHYSLEPIMLVVGLYLLSQIMYIVFIRIIDFTVCWKCVWPVYLPFLSVNLPLFCISFFAPFGAMTGGFALTMLVNILFFLILASLVKGFEELIRGMLERLLGDPSAGQSPKHRGAMLNKVGELSIPKTAPDKIPFINVKIPRALGGGADIPVFGGTKLGNIPDTAKKGLKGELYKAFGIDSLFRTHFRKEFERSLSDLKDPTKKEAQRSRAAAHIFSQGLLGKYGDEYKNLLQEASTLTRLSPAQVAMLPPDLQSLHSTLSNDSNKDTRDALTALAYSRPEAETTTSEVETKVFASADKLARTSVRTTFADIDQLQRLCDEMKKARKAAPDKEPQANIEK